MTKFTVYSYTFTGRCRVDTVNAKSKADAKFKVLTALRALATANLVKRQVAEKVVA